MPFYCHRFYQAESSNFNIRQKAYRHRVSTRMSNEETSSAENYRPASYSALVVLERRFHFAPRHISNKKCLELIIDTLRCQPQPSSSPFRRRICPQPLWFDYIGIRIADISDFASARTHRRISVPHVSAASFLPMLAHVSTTPPTYIAKIRLWPLATWPHALHLRCLLAMPLLLPDDYSQAGDTGMMRDFDDMPRACFDVWWLACCRQA
jgi:hypothetical protein